jgi:hypothetical protein
MTYFGPAYLVGHTQPDILHTHPSPGKQSIVIVIVITNQDSTSSYMPNKANHEESRKNAQWQGRKCIVWVALTIARCPT